MRKLKRVDLVFRNVILLFLFLLVLVIFCESCISIIGEGNLLLDMKSKMAGSTFFGLSLRSVICFIVPGTILLSAFLIFIFRRIDRIRPDDENKVMWVIGGLILLLQGIILFFMIREGMKGCTDTSRIIDQAMAMADTQDGKINNEMLYFARYGNNYSFTILLYYLYRIVRFFGVGYFVPFLMILNTILIDISGVFAIKLVRLLRGNLWGIRIMVLFLLCPTTYVWLLFTYTNTFSMPFVMGVLYFGIKAMRRRKHRIFNIILTAILGAVGYQIRATTIIPVIAVVMGALTAWRLRSYKEKILMIFIVMAIMGASMVISSKVSRSYLKNTSIDQTFPFTHWVMMGLNEKENGYVNSVDVQFSSSFTTKEKKMDYQIIRMKDRLVKMGPVRYAKLLVRKMREVWSVGEDGYQNFYKNGENFSGLYQYIFGDRSGAVGLYNQIFRCATFLFVVFSVFFQLRRRGVEEFFIISLTLLGAILFFLLWETNRKYNICFMGIVMILMGDGITRCSGFVHRMREKLTPSRRFFAGRAAGVAVVLVPAILTVLMVMDRQYYLQKEWDYRKVTIQNFNYREDYRDLKNAGDTAVQTFTTGKAFNEVRVIYGNFMDQKPEPDSFRFELLDPQGNVMTTQSFPQDEKREKKKKFWQSFDVPAVSSGSPSRKYTIRVTCLKTQESGLQLAISPHDEYDLYRGGELYLNSQRQKRDMAFSVSDKTKRASMSKGGFVASIALIWLLYGILVFRLINPYSRPSS